MVPHLTMDPFSWSVEDVVKALCSGPCPWAQDAASLAVRIREEEVDGPLFLTLEKTFSKEDLMNCLGIRKYRHQSRLLEELNSLRSQSVKYKEWHRDWLQKRQSHEFGQRTHFFIETEHDERGQPPVLNESRGYDGGSPQSNGHAVSTPQSLPRAEHEDDPSAQNETETLGPDGTEPDDLMMDAPTLPDTEELSLKKKRVAPINVTQTVNRPQPSNTFPWERSSPGSYIGPGSMPSYLIKSPMLPTSTRVMDLGNNSFVVGTPNHLPPGRRQAVNRTMKRLLLKNGREEALFRSGAAPMRSSTPSDEEDEVVDLANLPDWDERTLREMEEEEADNERARLLERRISQDEVAAIIIEVIDDITRKWQENKQHRLDYAAYKTWTAAMRDGSRLQQIIHARQQISSYDARIKLLSERIQSEHWQDRKDIRIQAQCLEQSVEDRLKKLWLIKTLELKQQPPKPHFLPPLSKPEKKERPFDPNDEVLTSSDEEDDFIVHDDFRPEAQGLARSDSEDALATPVRAESEMVVDLTHPSTQRAQKSRTVIDLTTTPIKANPPSTPKPQDPESLIRDQPSLEELDIEAIASVDRSYWAKNNDRWRLAIYVLRKLPHERRMAVFTLIMSGDDDEVWACSVISYTSQPFLTPEEILDAETGVDKFDLTRAFYCFAKCRHYKEQRLTPPGEKNTPKLLNLKPLFTIFCNFVRAVIDLFPQDSQILNTEDLDRDLLMEEMIGEDVDDPSQGFQAASPFRKSIAPRKEIVQNKDALYLRERQEKRDHEQEARRLKLRESLATSGVISQDRSRLIINESKEEGQSLIYVNEEIGKRIKDHQVDGVRFLWNQIIQDPDIRQGCLLAHTMGLGKTMQVITFLVAIAEACSSSDPSQIPEDLHSARTLVLCPSGLVENWMDEFLKWAPEGVLGKLTQIDSSKSTPERKSIIETWTKDRGVLIIGYNMFTKALSLGEEIESMLLETPTIVVADEAHKLKNRETQLNAACSRFTTKSRIALTGSPLANNVEEYYAMIDWVAPNYLGPLAEFREIYVRDIEAGFFRDSSSWEKRKALIRLQALTRTVAPKVNRATVKSCLANDLPAKSEYVIFLTPTALQQELYNMYISNLGAVSGNDDLASGRIFNTVNDLALICNHPRSFKSKLLKVEKDPRLHASFPKDMLKDALQKMAGLDEHHPSLSLKTEFLSIILDEARRVNDKVLVFSHSLHTLDYLEQMLRSQNRRTCRLDGRTKIQERQDLIKSFNRGNVEVFLISTTAGGVGLNIYGANRVVIFDSRWNPVEAQQAVGRAYRLGQTKKVSVYHFMLAGTFEEDIHNRAVFKTQLAQRVVDKANPLSWSQRDAKLIHFVKPSKKKDLSGLAGKDHVLDRLIAFRALSEPTEQLISSIVPTDTFEEEDPEHALTDREKQEADQMYEMNTLRRTDPQRYERMRVEQNLHNHASAHLQPPLAASLPMPPPSNAPIIPAAVQRSSQPAEASGGRGMRHQNVNTWRISSHTGRHEGPVLQGVRGSQGTPHNQATVFDRGLPQSAPPPSSAPAAAPLPGTHTFFGVLEPQRPASTPSSPPVLLAVSNNTPPRSQAGIFAQPTSPEKEEFKSRVMHAVSRVQSKEPGLIRRDKPVTYYTNPLISAIEDVQRQKSAGFLPENQQWKVLNDLLGNDRFVLSAVAGHLSPKFLVHAGKDELEKRMETINGLSDEDFRVTLHKLLGPRVPSEVPNPSTR